MVGIVMNNPYNKNKHNEKVNKCDGQATIEPSLFTVFKLAAQTNIDEAIEHTRQFCFQAASDQTKRTGLEFLYAYGFLDDLNKLIEINIATENACNQQWAKLYQIIMERRQKRLDPDAYMDKLSELSFDSAELKCLRDFLYVYSYYERRQFHMLGNYLDPLLDRIYEIKDLMLKELFSIRLDEILMTYHWKRSEMIIARKHGYRILATTKNNRKKIDIHSNMALGYLFEDYEQAIHHAREAQKLADQIEFKPAINWLKEFTIPFISAYHRRTDGVTTNDKAEQAHLALANGDNETCIQILNEFAELSPFQQYYLGKAMEDQSLLQTSYNRFIHERNDYFFAKLPLKEMHRLANREKRVHFK
ncbi:AimR family lysis-lysogeny pheromone receptor [Radiobacillus sp. PE A8.2]|uniref:AimR family lysis-lysogeny pheromone receptor n=1 Tax=Radiobacillus sp. PE A8.2 TaxID=3380349 RepID=UPI00388F8AE0